MNYNDFLSEAPRVETLKPSKDTEAKKKIREPGDVGKVDRLTQMDKDKTGPAVRAVPGMKGAIRLKKRNIRQPGPYVDRVADEGGEARPEPKKNVTASDDKKKLSVKPTSRSTIQKPDKTFDEIIQQ